MGINPCLWVRTEGGRGGEGGKIRVAAEPLKKKKKKKRKENKRGIEVQKNKKKNNRLFFVFTSYN